MLCGVSNLTGSRSPRDSP